jgi:hypothetical protein
MSDETLNWARKKGFAPSMRGELVQSGPIKKQLGGKVSTFTKGLDGETSLMRAQHLSTPFADFVMLGENAIHGSYPKGSCQQS